MDPASSTVKLVDPDGTQFHFKFETTMLTVLKHACALNNLPYKQTGLALTDSNGANIEFQADSILGNLAITIDAHPIHMKVYPMRHYTKIKSSTKIV